MPFNASGVFQRLYNWRSDRDAGIKILAERVDNETDGLAQGLNDVVQGNVAHKGPIKAPNGTATLPAYSFETATDTGFFLDGNGVLRASRDATDLGTFTYLLSRRFTAVRRSPPPKMA